MLYKLIFLILFLLTVIAISSCNKNEALTSKNKSAVLDDNILPVEVRTVQKTLWTEDVSVYGNIKEKDKVDIFSKMPGKLIRLLVKEGQYIQNNKVIAIVDRDEVGLSFKEVEVKSTAAGKVETLYLKEGARVSDANPILSISKQEDLKLIVELFETDLVKIRIGQRAIITLDALPNREFTGKVTLIKPNLNPQSGKCGIEITFDHNYPEILPGMFGRVSIIINQKMTLAVVPDAIKKINGTRAVYVVKDGIAKLTFVELGLQKTYTVEILKGINAGDTIIIFALDELKDGTRVKIVEGSQQ